MTRFFRVSQLGGLSGVSERCFRRAIARGRLVVTGPPNTRVVLIREDEAVRFLGAPRSLIGGDNPGVAP